MGYRVHAVSRKMQSGDTEAFNYKNDEFNRLLNCLCCDTSGEDYYDELFECNVLAYKRAIEILKAMRDGKSEKDIKKIFQKKKYQYANGEYDYLDTDDAQSALEELENDGGYNIGDVIDVMETFLKEADTKDGYIAFSCW